jgi:uncharacterized protein YggT (Ycf19 family)
VSLEAFTVLVIKSLFFWGMMLYHLLIVPEHFKEPLRFLHHGFESLLKPFRPFLVEGMLCIKNENHGCKCF